MDGPRDSHRSSLLDVQYRRPFFSLPPALRFCQVPFMSFTIGESASLPLLADLLLLQISLPSGEHLRATSTLRWRNASLETVFPASFVKNCWYGRGSEKQSAFYREEGYKQVRPNNITMPKYPGCQSHHMVHGQLFFYSRVDDTSAH